MKRWGILADGKSTNSAPSALLHIDHPKAATREGFVFISYKSEEAAAAQRIRDALQQAGFPVWWDRQIQCGQAWSQVLDDAVKRAACIIVLWSPRATTSRWVVHEASVALARNNYAPARIELCSIPAPYDQLQATDIVDWDGQSEHPGVRNLLARCAALLPPRRTLWSRAFQAAWSYRWAGLAVAFGAAAIGILADQTIAGRSQLRRLNEVVDKLGEFQTQVDKNIVPQLGQQLQRLDAVAARQGDTTARLGQFQTEAEQNVMRGYYHLEPLTIQFTLEYPLSGKSLSGYVARLQKDPVFARLMRMGDREIYLQERELAFLLPNAEVAEERPAAELLLSDETALVFVDTKQQADPNSRSFARKYTPDRGVVRFGSYSSDVAPAFTQFPRRGEIERGIELYLHPGEMKFIKKVRCKNPIRSGDDLYAFSVVDLIGRTLRYEASEARMREAALAFQFNSEGSNSHRYPSANRARNPIVFPPNASEVVITPQHVGLGQNELPEDLRAARARYSSLTPPQQRRLLNAEISRRLGLFADTLDRVQFDVNWRLVEWRKAERVADALDGYAASTARGAAGTTFEQRSFKWLLSELVRVSDGAERETASKAVAEAKRLFNVLARVDEEPDDDKVARALLEARGIAASRSFAPWTPPVPDSARRAGGNGPVIPLLPLPENR